MTAPEVLRVEQVTKVFGGLKALANVSVSVSQGEVVGLIGPNGAGKSTLFEVISGNTPPTAGRIFLFGQDVTKTSPDRRRRAGMSRTFQKVRLFESLTAQENIAVAAMQCAAPGHDWRAEVASALERLKLTPLAQYYPSELTLADRKKIEIGRAIVGNCRLLLLDEALSGLTVDEADELVAVILSMNAELGVTIVVVEHVLPVLVSMAHRLVVLNFGSVIADGAPRDVASDPKVMTAYFGSKRGAFA
jgi:branched-chain amino acid transport system ATP-binding protein